MIVGFVSLMMMTIPRGNKKSEEEEEGGWKNNCVQTFLLGFAVQSGEENQGIGVEVPKLLNRVGLFLKPSSNSRMTKMEEKGEGDEQHRQGCVGQCLRDNFRQASNATRGKSSKDEVSHFFSLPPQVKFGV